MKVPYDLEEKITRLSDIEDEIKGARSTLEDQESALSDLESEISSEIEEALDEAYDEGQSDLRDEIKRDPALRAELLGESLDPKGKKTIEALEAKLKQAREFIRNNGKGFEQLAMDFKSEASDLEMETD